MEAVKPPPVLGVEKPPCWVGKRFRDHLEAAPKKNVKIPAGLEMRPAWRGWDRLGTCPMVHRGDTDCRVAVQAFWWLTAMTSPHDPTRMVKDQGPRSRTAKKL